MSHHGETNVKCVLLVDDEAIVRRTCQRMLTRMGYDVLDAPDGQSAIAIYQQHWRSISVILLDMFMPRMNGSATLQKLRQVNPDAKVIIASGFPQDEMINSLLDSHTVTFMRKPFGLKELMDTVHRISIQA